MKNLTPLLLASLLAVPSTHLYAAAKSEADKATEAAAFAAVPENAMEFGEIVESNNFEQREIREIERIEETLNGLKTVAADFLQITDDGRMIRGALAIKRPGKMRVEYDKPVKDFMVADGTFMHMWDSQLKQQTSIPLGENLANFILRDNIRLKDDLTVTKLERFPRKIEMTLVETKQPANGQITLVFQRDEEAKKLRLRQWRVTDATGAVTGVNLEAVSENMDMNDKLFVFQKPDIGVNKNADRKR
jgi:outer membrane lipoprotein-sorting protein